MNHCLAYNILKQEIKKHFLNMKQEAKKTLFGRSHFQTPNVSPAYFYKSGLSNNYY